MRSMLRRPRRVAHPRHDEPRAKTLEDLARHALCRHPSAVRFLSTGLHTVAGRMIGSIAWSRNAHKRLDGNAAVPCYGMSSS